MNRGTDPSIDGLTGRAVERAEGLIRRSRELRTRRDRANRRRFARLFRDPAALDVTITLTDDVMRFASTRAAAKQLRRSARRASVRGFGAVNAVGLRALSRLSAIAPGAAVAVTHARVRALTRDLIGDDDPRALSSQVARRRAAGEALNVNVLGEAVLGEREAQDRLSRVLEMIARDDVDYVSVKLSALVSQIVTFDHDGSRERVAARLRTLYRAAASSGTFVNLDMEEYRDLRMTVDAFTLVLGEDEFAGLTAGIVLQAYLPESHDVLVSLATWARERVAAGGAPIKIRLVKGANLAMERAESQLHGWTAAPYDTKADVDASYLRLLDVALSRSLAGILRVGVASHNLFHVAWALEVARERGVEDQLDVEMLEGMAPSEAAALVESGQRVLLYAPVTRRDDFAAAVAYLVRRLDENTSPENYLRAAFSFDEAPTALVEQRERFVAALAARHHVATHRRRRGVPVGAVFANEPDGDPTDPDYVAAVESARAVIYRSSDVTIGDALDDLESGIDPSDGGRVWYHYGVATRERVDDAVARARVAAQSWAGRDGALRARVLADVAEVMAKSRARSIAVMARDTGKTVAEADPEVSEAIDFVRYYAGFSEGGDMSRPLGVVLVVPPWNFPYSIPTGGVAAALAAGNTVILKPAPEAVAVAAEIAEQFWAAGVPRDVLQFLPTRDDDVGRHLVTHDGVDAVILTGSFDTARLFLSWKPSLRLLAETSGKNAILVSACADVDQAVRDVVSSAFSHAGQKCSAASLAIVERSLWEDSTFVAQLTDAVTSLATGSARDSSTVVGPLVRPPGEALARALASCDPGESWLVEPRQLDEAGFSWSPGVKVGVAPGSWSHLNEWFGPVLGVMVAPDFATALRWQNQVPFGLTAGIASLDEDECTTWIDGVEAGNLYVNRGVTGAVVRRQPFGGWKMSSVGPTAKAGGAHYVDALRDWARVSDASRALEDAARWFRDVGGTAHDVSGLEVERNVARYRRRGPIVVRVAAGLSAAERDYLVGLITLTGVEAILSSADRVDGLDVDVEDVTDVVRRARAGARVRWLSDEAPPVFDLLDAGVSVDPRPLAQAGSIEAPRWLFEQSVSITRHRYGNVHAGPQPRCDGLSNATTTP
ncbi:MAG: proline dehydrogenase family protein [Acidobacteria bacterium]|nr:proline dehydrogenase family protein [Acidobacteriota bacterium]